MNTTYCFTDTETGGLDDRMNPLLSAALILTDSEFNEIDGFASKLLPPENSWLEVPVKSQQVPNFGYGHRNIDHYLNVHTRETTTYKPKDGWLLVAAAVETNGFVKFDNDGWDMTAIDSWMNDSISLDIAEEVFVRWMAKHCAEPPIGVAHNAQFDYKFINRHMPQLHKNYAVIDSALRNDKKHSELSSGWFCTCLALKKWNKASPTPGENAKLGTLAKLAGYQPTDAHEALADARSCLAGLRWLKTGKLFQSNCVQK